MPKAVQQSDKPGLRPGSGQVLILCFDLLHCSACAEGRLDLDVHYLKGFSSFKHGSPENYFIKLTELGQKTPRINDARRQIPASGGTESHVVLSGTVIRM